MDKDIFPREKITKLLIQKILSQYFNDFKLTSFKIIKFGIENQTVVVDVNKQKYAIRIYNRFQFGIFKRLKTHILWEIDFMNYLRSKGIPIPQILSTKDDQYLISIELGQKKYFVVISKFIGGRHVKSFNPPKMKAAMKLQASLHRLGQDFKTTHKRANLLQYGFEEYVLKDLDRKIVKYPTHAQMLTELWEIVDKNYPKLIKLMKQKKKIAIHDDLNRENFKFIGNKIVGIFDFDDCLLGYPKGELGKTIFFLIDKTKSPKVIDGQIRKAIGYYSNMIKLNAKDKEIIHLSLLVSWASRKFAGFDGKKKEIIRARACINYYRAYIKAQ